MRTVWRTQCVAMLLAAGFALTGCVPVDSTPAGTVIVNARVIDGSGGPSRDVNVRIEGDRIAAIGDFEPSAGDSVVEADGLVLAPGFIDVHSHHDSRLFEMPEALAAVNQGITTIVAGQDGGHQHPLGEFFAQLETSPAAVNVASYAGFAISTGGTAPSTSSATCYRPTTSSSPTSCRNRPTTA